MKLSRSIFVCTILSLPLAAQEISNDGMFVSAAGYSQSGRFEWIDGVVPNSGGMVRGPNGELAISLNAVFADLRAGGVQEPIDIDGVQVSLRWLPSGELFIELNDEDWELVYSESIAENQWETVIGDPRFEPDGEGWRLAKEEISDSMFLRARLK